MRPGNAPEDDEDRLLCWFAEDQAAWGLAPKRPGQRVELLGSGVKRPRG